MKPLVAFLVMVISLLVGAPAASADGEDVDGEVDTVADAVRVTIVRSGGSDTVSSVSGGGAGERDSCDWSVVFVPTPEVVPEESDFGAKPHPDAQLALLLCDGAVVQSIWVMPNDIVDLDAAAQTEAQRYIEDVLVPAVGIGVNPAARGLVGLESWFWIDGFDGQVTAPPITAFGLTIEVRMSTGSVSWDFGHGTVENGDLGRVYPERSTVRHAHQRDGSFTITAAIDLVPEYRVGSGPWITLPNLQAVASTAHAVEERQAVVTET